MLMSRPDPEEVERSLIVERSEPLAAAELPRVSIIILNWNGRHHLEPCFSTLRRLDYPEDLFEVVLEEQARARGAGCL